MAVDKREQAINTHAFRQVFPLFVVIIIANTERATPNAIKPGHYFYLPLPTDYKIAALREAHRPPTRYNPLIRE
jgi:hypothetical protein